MCHGNIFSNLGINSSRRPVFLACEFSSHHASKLNHQERQYFSFDIALASAYSQSQYGSVHNS
jgi:hypothetical protein